jgi:hypothetical protein
MGRPRSLVVSTFLRKYMTMVTTPDTYVVGVLVSGFQTENL